jgi:hypothetical protein
MDDGDFNAALNKEFPQAKIYLNGNYGRIHGCREDDANSLDFLLNKIEDRLPEALILGNISQSDLFKYRVGETAAMLKSPTY